MSAIKNLAKRLPVIRSLIVERDLLSEQGGRLTRENLQLRSDYMDALAQTTDYFLSLSKGVIHIGANAGQERFSYAKYSLPVIWVEPIEEVFESLTRNIQKFSNQRALKYLLTDVDDKSYEFHISNNSGLSSSILELSSHKEIWPEVDYVNTRTLVGTTFETVVKREALDLSQYDTIVMDTQGSELLVLRGVGALVSSFKYLKIEAADFEMYKGCCTVTDLKEYLEPLGFAETIRRRIAGRPSIGDCFDVVFERVTNIDR